jgi:pimeloyl-ACP methyl ester carboxylesterase
MGGFAVGMDLFAGRIALHHHRGMDRMRPSLVDVGIHTIAYRRGGSGPALLLLHGFLSDSRVWSPQFELADRFTVIAWDAPGAGSSSDPDAPFTITDWATSLSAFLDALGIYQTHVVGLSWGGLLAQELWRTDRPRVRSLVLADTYAGWMGSFGAATAQQRLTRCIRDSSLPAATLVRDWVPEFFTRSAPSDLIDEMSAIVSGYHPTGFRLMAETLAVADTNELLRRVDVPSLLLWGADDRRSPMDVAEALLDAIPDAELRVIPDAGHVSNMEQPLVFNEHVARFCSSVDAR